jgi:hypothetical protein
LRESGAFTCPFACFVAYFPASPTQGSAVIF